MMSVGAELIAVERRRQVEKEGWTADHDDNALDHGQGQIANAAVAYLLQPNHPFATTTRLTGCRSPASYSGVEVGGHRAAPRTDRAESVDGFNRGLSGRA